MQYIAINAAPILLAALAGFAVSLLYAAAVKRAGRGGTGGVRGAVGLAVVAFVAQGWLACILAGALILAPRGAGAWTMALGSAVVIWIGFVLPSVFVSLRFRGSPVAAALLDGLLWLAVMLVQAAVLQLVGVSRPA